MVIQNIYKKNNNCRLFDRNSIADFFPRLEHLRRSVALQARPPRHHGDQFKGRSQISHASQKYGTEGREAQLDREASASQTTADKIFQASLRFINQKLAEKQTGILLTIYFSLTIYSRLEEKAYAVRETGSFSVRWGPN